jgi:RNA polymerase sigma-70 factor (ECF subfamily)
MTEANKELLESLVEQARAGSRPAFSKIVRLLMNGVTALTYRMTGDRDAALDLAQDTFVSAWENIRTYRGDAGFSSWLYRIASNKTLNYLKAPARQTVDIDSMDDQNDSGAAGPERLMEKKELAERIRSFMETLPTQQRMIFELRFYKEMPFEEIARTTERALGTVKTGYREAVKKLRAFAQKEGWK